MFVPVSCTNCGKPFQVPEAALGKLAPCPWCQAVVTALPVSAPIPQPEPARQRDDSPSPAMPKVPQEPLSLDEAEPIPAAKGPPAEPVTAPPAPRKWKHLLVPIFVALALMVFGTIGTLLFRSYGAGRMSDSGWIEFTPADGSFAIALPGTPAEEPVDAYPPGSVTGGKRYAVHGWYSKTDVWVAANDLDPGLVPKLPADRDRVIAAGVLQAEREREKARLGGTVTNEVPYRLSNWWGVELHLDTPRGKVVEWLILVGTGPHPRVYVFGAEAKGLTPQSPVCRRLFNSFRVTE